MMQKIFRFGVTATTLLVSLLVGVTFAEAQNSLLKGTYDLSSSRVCVNASDFTTPDLALVGPGFMSSHFDTGTAVFKGDGTGTASGQTLGIGLNSTAPGTVPANEGEFTCNITYTVNPDKTYVTDVTCTGTALSGPSAGQQSVSTFHNEGKIISGGSILITTRTDPIVETATNLTTGSSSKRICHRNTQFYKR